MNGFMKDFIITTDTTTDLPASYVNEHHLGMMSLPYTIENQTYTWEHSLPKRILCHDAQWFSSNDLTGKS